MAKYIIQGGYKLKGKVKIAGNKNSVFPTLAASLLTDEQVTLRNIPQILDTKTTLDILKILGSEINYSDSVITIRTKKIATSKLPSELMKKLRGAIVLVGSLLSRECKAQFVHPGGDVIGKRDIDIHIEGFNKLGFDYQIQDLEYKVFRKQLQLNNLNATEEKQFFLRLASVTATENLILASVLGNSKVTLKNCAKEPHVLDLCNMLTQMGAAIEGIGESTIKITGVGSLKGVDFTISPDYLEAGVYAIAASITGGEIVVDNFNLKDMEPVVYPLEKMGLSFKQIGSGVKVRSSNLQAIPKLITNFWPGFPTDMMSLVIVLATKARGVSLLHDWIFESRMFFVDKLISMGANITIADPHRVVVYGPTKLFGRELESPDIRAGMALVLASLVAEGKSIINKAELIERGYENVVGNLSSLGAQIERVE